MLTTVNNEAAMLKGYQSLAAFFTGTDLENTLRQLYQLVKAACSGKPCSTKKLHSLIPFTHNLEELCIAAFAIKQYKQKKPAATLPPA